MAADWDEIARIPVPSSVNGIHQLPNPATAVIFDDQQELIWVGNADGRVASFRGPDLQRYTSARAHINEGQVQQLLAHERGILSISSTSVHLISRTGPAIWHLTHPEMTDLRCMCLTNNPNHILVAGCQKHFFVVDLEKGTVVSQHPSKANYIIMKKSRHICAATDDGYVQALSLENFAILKSWLAHVKTINDMDVRNDFMVTCGYSVWHMGAPTVDLFAKVYDLKNLTSMPPIPFHAGAAYVRLHPKLQTTSVVVSQTGQMQVVDLMNPVNIILKQANVQLMLGLEISQTGDALIITDTNGLLYLWASPGKTRFNSMSKETELAESSPPPTSPMDWNDMPLNTIGLPHYSERLLSSWPSHLVFEVGAPSLPQDPALMPYMQPAELGTYAPNLNLRKTHRYQVENTRIGVGASSIAAPKFLSEKAKDLVATDEIEQMSSTAEALVGINLNGKAQTEDETMLKYNKVEIKYSRFGVDDFDFSYFNKTSFSGLETHISNSFINSLLQLYKFIPLVRNLAIQHAATSCVTGGCLLCEFGFLFDMLEKAAGANCQATNLLRTFGASREAANMNLFEAAANANGVPLSNTIQSINRFFLKQIAHDYVTMTGSSDGVDEVLATKAVEAIRCIYCGNETTKHASMYVHDLTYPQIDPKHHRPHMLRFSSVLKTTLERETKNRGWCNRCRRYQQLAIRKTIRQLPYVLMLNTALVTPSARAIWETSGWLPSEIGISVQDRAIYCFEGSDLALHVRNKSPNLVVYELVGYVADVDADDRQQPHLVGVVDAEVSTPSAPLGPGQKAHPNWHLFNDFLVSPIDAREALHFNKTWKMPSVVCYQVKSGHGKIDNSWKHTLDTTLLLQPYSINGLYPKDEVQLLGYSQIPSEGTPIALDTEFVELEKAEIDVKADGSQETIRPAKSGLARVSVLQGSGEQEGIPFIDDYITIHETIVDYKTQYSGIRPGDLDPHTSQHNLVQLKVAYKKLWLLLNLGCSFVGHGLASDFRKANIHVPKSQTIDTQYLFLAPGKNRRLSLRYLAWAVFREFIQEETFDDTPGDGHDSIEDARMALRLWRKFQEYEEADIVEQMIEEIYRKGARYGWKPPLRSGANLVPDGVHTGGNSAFASGRNTPEVGGGTPLPGTPGGKGSGAFKLSALGVESFVPGNGTPKESPLR